MISIPLTDQMSVAVIDDEDFEKVQSLRWHKVKGNHTTYCQAWMPRPNAVLLHRFVMECPPKLVVHHWDCDGLNNQKHNLAICTYSINELLAKVPGVHWETSRSKWKAVIMVDGKTRFLGRFVNREDAEAAYNAVKNDVLSAYFGFEVSV